MGEMHETSVMQDNTAVPFLSLICKIEATARELRKTGSIILDGQSLDVGAVVAVARYDCIPGAQFSDLADRLSASVKVVERSYQHGDILYGVNTGFGGSADTRTRNGSALEKSLMQTLQSAVLTSGDRTGVFDPLGGLPSHSMPLPWVKGMMAVRINSCLRGHSGVSQTVIDAVLKLLEHRITPVIPLRGSISASGDLMPLSYVAGTLEGSPDLFVRLGDGQKSSYQTAHAALESCGLPRLTLGPRDGLALVNGTSASAAVASLAMYDAGQLVLLSTMVTALAAEGMAAKIDWLHQFVHDIRPHAGQIEAAHIMRRLLQDSSLVIGLKGVAKAEGSLVESFDGALAQDRYPLRTSPQWIGPQLDDLLHAHTQIAIELNSTSDNPVADARIGEVYCGGNFQAASITSAVEKIRLSIQMVGKMIFSQCTEMINHKMSNGLPANLAADDPSTSYCLKGLDINMAAYQSELAFLANPVSNHVQSAEMHNQAINSLALLSARYTFQSIEIVALMTASALYAACQAVDVRVLHATFLQSLPPLTESVCSSTLYDTTSLQSALVPANHAMSKSWWATASRDAADRSDQAAWAFVHTLTGLTLATSGPDSPTVALSVAGTRYLHASIKTKILEAFYSHRTAFMHEPDTAKYLGSGTSRLYTYIRKDLGVPMHHGLADHPGVGTETGSQKTIGSQVSIIYEAVRDGRLFGAMVDVVADLGLHGADVKSEDGH